MLDSLYGTAARISTGRWVILLGIVFMISGYLNVGKPFGIAQLEEITGGVGALDVEMFAAAEDIYDVLDRQGEAGRQFYRRLLLTTELVFPLVYRLFNVVFMSFTFGRWLGPQNKWTRLSLAPVVGMIADYVENALVLTMLSRYPQRLVAVGSIVGIVTTVKWFSNYLDYALMAIGLLGWLVTLIRRRRRS